MIHSIRVDQYKFSAKPKDNDIKGIQHRLRNSKSEEKVTIDVLYNYFLSGHTVIAAKLNNDMQALETSLLIIDIDDDEGLSHIDDFLDLFNDEISFYYYSFSKTSTNNRLRLVFQLQEQISPSLHKYIAECYLDRIQAYFELKGIKSNLFVDNASSRIKGLWFGTCNGGGFISQTNRISKLTIDRYKKRFEVQCKKERLDRFKKNNALDLEDSISYDDLLTMANSIGKIHSGELIDFIDSKQVSANEAWSTLLYSIRSYEKRGFISYNESFNIASEISGDGLTDKEFQTFNNVRDYSIGTFIKYAIQCGFHFNNSFTNDTDEFSIKSEYIKVDKYVPTELMIKLLTSNQKILIEAPTGSGKTYSTIEAIKQIENSVSDTIYIFATPTRALAKQISKDYKVPLVIGGINNSEFSISHLYQKGNRCFITTYDTAPTVIQHSLAKEVVLIVDEVHLLSTGRSYREETIVNLMEIANHSKGFIGITATSDDVHQTDFERRIIVKNNTKQNFKDFHVIEWSNRVNNKTDTRIQNSVVINTIAAQRRAGIKSLCFINNKKRIEEVKQALIEKGLKVFTIYRDGKKDSDEYEQIIANDIDDSIDVILATKIISEGVSLHFKDKWNIMSVSDNTTRSYNPSEIKQQSHRIRNQYENFILITRKSNDINKNAKPYFKNRNLKILFNRANRISTYLNGLGTITNNDLYKIEKRYGLYVEDNNVKIDMQVLNSYAVIDKEKYYSRPANRNVFINEVEKALKVKARRIDWNKEAMILTEEQLEKLLIKQIEVSKLSNEQMQHNFKKWFTKDIHDVLYIGNVELVPELSSNEFKRTQHELGKARTNALINVCSIVDDYTIAKNILLNINNVSQTNLFINRLKTYNDIKKWETRKRRSATQVLYENLLAYFKDTETTSSNFKILYKQYALKKKVTVKDVELALSYATELNRRIGKQRLKKYVPFNQNKEADFFMIPLKKFIEYAEKVALFS